MVNFWMPESDRDEGQKQIVDSLAVVSDWTVVSKCVPHGLIYVWDLKKTLEAGGAALLNVNPLMVSSRFVLTFRIFSIFQVSGFLNRCLKSRNKFSVHVLSGSRT